MELQRGEIFPMTSARVMTHRCTTVDNEMAPTLDETPGTLESDVGPDVYRELLESFVAHLSLQVITLNAAVDDGDVPVAQGVAHQIKGTASSFGATRLDELSKRVLQMADTEVELLRSLVHEIDAEVETFQAAVATSAPPT
jgi:HPt (histidine-containing phosphotransfer) domain-containing protein